VVSYRLISFILWLGDINKAVNFHMVHVALDTINGLFIFEDNGFDCSFLIFCDFDPQSLKVARSKDLVIDFAEIFLVEEH
jgi:hypothetical protein